MLRARNIRTEPVRLTRTAFVDGPALAESGRREAIAFAVAHRDYEVRSNDMRRFRAEETHTR